MIDNFDYLVDLFDFENCIYFIDIIQRRKEHPSLSSNSKVLYHFFVKSEKDYTKYKTMVMDMCKLYNARAYITINGRSESDVAYTMIEEIGKRMKVSNFNMYSVFRAAFGITSPIDKKWMIDIDDKNLLHPILDFLAEKNVKIHKVVPTVNGYHVICDKIDMREYNFPCEIHKNNMTLLAS